MQMTLRAVLALLILVTAPVHARQNPTGGAGETEAMKRDLKIMEGVLNVLLDGAEAGGILVGVNKTRASYIPGFGVLFQTRAKNTLIHILERKARADRNNDSSQEVAEKEVHVMTRKKDGDGRKTFPMEEIIVFLRDYAGNIRNLKENELLMVVTPERENEDFSDRVFFPLKREEDKVAVFVEVGTVRRFRAGKMTEAEFRKAIKKSELSADRHTQRSLRVFAGILNTALQGNAQHTFSLDGDVDYVYISGHGALFSGQAKFVGGDALNVLFQSDAGEVFDRQGQLFGSKKTGKEKKSPEAARKKIWAFTEVAEDSSVLRKRLDAFESFEQDIIETLVDYGRTLRILKPDEQIILALKIRRGGEGLPSQVVYRLRAEDVRRYDRGELKKAQVVRRVKTFHF